MISLPAPTRANAAAGGEGLNAPRLCRFDYFASKLPHQSMGLTTGQKASLSWATALGGFTLQAPKSDPAVT
ncbi:hypothetical protein GN278_10375 [Rhodobacteraceae bacterium Araon29]